VIDRPTITAPPSDEEHPGPPSPFDTLLQPHHHFDPSWLEEAEIIVTATLEQGRYPCIWRPNGVRDIPLRRTLVIDQVIRGTLPRGSFDLNFAHEPTLGFPLEAHDGRRYLVFLRPSDDARLHLQDPDFVFGVHTQLQPREFVAIVDLDQSEAEAREQRERITRWQDLESFELTEGQWRRTRESPTVDQRTTESFLHAIRRSLFPEWRRREDVRSALGPPDDVRRGDDGLTIETYFLDPAARGAPVSDTFYGRFELGFEEDGTLMTYGEGFDILEGEDLRQATYEEYTARGMTTHGIDRRR